MVDTATPAHKLQVLAELLDADETLFLSVDLAENVTLAEGTRFAEMGLDAAPSGPLATLFAGDDGALARWRRCLAGERSRAESVHGDTQWLQLFHPLRGAGGAVIGAAMLALDVTLALPNARHAKLLRELVNNVPTNVFAVDTDGVCQISEGGMLAQIGLEPGQNVGVNVFTSYDMIPGMSEAMRKAFRGEANTLEFRFGDSLYSQINLPRRDSFGANAGVYCIASDITKQRRDEELLREQMRLIQEQKEAILRLSSPIIEVGHDVLAIPLVGSIDGDRAAIIMHGLLEAIAGKRAQFAILDLTGVDTVDPGSAEHLIRIIHSVRMLGAQAIITGIRPAIAQTMASLGLDLSGLHTLRSLQDALRYCDVSARAR